MGITKTIVFLISFGVVFGLGFLMGSQRMDGLGQALTKFRSETSDKTSGLEEEVRGLRKKIHIFSARHHLVSAQNSILEQNYGTTRKELEKFEKEMKTLKKLSGKKNRKSLSRLEKPLEDLIAKASRADPRIKQPLQKLQTDFDSVWE